MRAPLELAGQKFGMLKVLCRDNSNTDSRTRWLCLCDCGMRTVKRGELLRNGKTKSCGCLVKITSARIGRISNLKHGHRNSITYKSWQRMKTRCCDPNSDRFEGYGAKGISVCERWKNSFENFLEDMGERPSPKHSIDRYPNISGNYEPGNCRWATVVEQANNTKSNRIVVYCGKSMTLANAIRAAGSVVYKDTARYRIDQLCWSVERAVETPPALQGRASIPPRKVYTRNRKRELIGVSA